QVACIEIALRTDPGVIADDATAARASLDEGLLADEDAVADLECLWMRGDGATTDPHPVTEPASQRAPDRAAHLLVMLGLAHRMARRELQQLVARTGAPEPIAQLQLTVGVARNRLDAVDRGHEAGHT